MSDNIGYFQLHRKIWENPFFAPGERFDRRSAWIYLISKANYKPGVIIRMGRVIHVQRGQFPTSTRHLAMVWGWDRKTVERFLRAMENEKMITLTGTQTGTLITICNYNKYQVSGDRGSEEGATEGATEGTAESATPGTAEGATTKEYKKNIKKSKKETRGGRVLE